MANICTNNINIIIDTKYKDDIFINDKFFNLSSLYNGEENYDSCNYPETYNEHVIKIEDARDFKEWTQKYFTSFSTKWDYPNELLIALSNHPWVYYIEWWFEESWNWILWSIYYNYEKDNEEDYEKWHSLSIYYEDFPEYAICELTDFIVHKNLPEKESAYWYTNSLEDNINVTDYISYFYNNENLSNLRINKEEILDSVLWNVKDTLYFLDYDSQEIKETLQWIKNYIENNYL